MQTYIDSSHNESERRTLYPEQNTLYFENVLTIHVDIDSTTPQKRKNGIEEDRQEDHQIPFGKNEEDDSIIASETIEQNASKNI